MTGGKKGRERVWPAEDDGVAHVPRGKYFKGETIFEDEVRNKKFALGGSTEIWISGRKVDVRETWLRDFVVFFFRPLSHLLA